MSLYVAGNKWLHLSETEGIVVVGMWDLVSVGAFALCCKALYSQGGFTFPKMFSTIFPENVMDLSFYI